MPPAPPWLIYIVLSAISAAIFITWLRSRRKTYEPELRRELTQYHVTLFSVRAPKLFERSPFPFLALDLTATASNIDAPRTIAYRIITLRTQDGREHQAWARLDFDPARPSVGLDYLQIDFLPKISDLKADRA